MDLDEPGNIRLIGYPMGKGVLCEVSVIIFHILRGIGMALEICYLKRQLWVWLGHTSKQAL